MVTATKGVLINWYLNTKLMEEYCLFSLSLSLFIFLYSIYSIYSQFSQHFTHFFPSEPAVKEILLLLDSTMNFIIEDLDATHLFIDPSQVEAVQRALQQRLAENVYKPPL